MKSPSLRYRVAGIGTLLQLALFATLSFAQAESSKRLDPAGLRLRLHSLWTAIDLAVRNEKIDAKDVLKQEQDLKQLQAFQKIPLDTRDAPREFQASLEKSIRASGLSLKSFHWVSRGQSKPKPSISGYSLSPSQLVRELRIELEIRASAQGLSRWVEGWGKLNGEPFMEWDGPPGDSPPVTGRLEPIREWKLRLRSYRFLRIELPPIHVASPRTFLPDWARKSPKAFSQAEPELWRYVVKTEALLPKARSLCPTRVRFLLNHARLSFFLRKMRNPPGI